MHVDVAELVNSHGGNFHITVPVSESDGELRHVVLVPVDHGAHWHFEDVPTEVPISIIGAILLV
jgi:hypothetical protein